MIVTYASIIIFVGYLNQRMCEILVRLNPKGVNYICFDIVECQKIISIAVKIHQIVYIASNCCISPQVIINRLCYFSEQENSCAILHAVSFTLAQSSLVLCKFNGTFSTNSLSCVLLCNQVIW